MGDWLVAPWYIQPLSLPKPKIGASSVTEETKKSFNHVQEIVELLLLLQKLSEYLQLTSKFLRNDRSGKANSSWIYTALLNLQLHTPAHTQAHVLQQSPWPLRGCGDTWLIEKYLEIL